MFFFQRLGSSGNLFIFIAGVLLAIYLFLLIALVFLGQVQLKAAQQQRAVSELEKQAAALAYFIAEQKDALRELASDRAINTYLANQALGMSMQYGLRASLLQVVTQLQWLKERKRVHGKPFYRRLIYFDMDKRALVDDTSVLPEGVRWERPVPLPDSDVVLLLTSGPGCALACLAVPINYKDRMAGFLVAEMDFRYALNNLLKSRLSDTDHRLVLRDKDGMVVFPQGLTPANGQERNPLRSVVTGTDLVLENTFKLGGAEEYLVSPWLPAAISLLTLPLLFGLGYLLHLNNQNLVLTTQHEAIQENRAIVRRQRDMQRIISETAARLLETSAIGMDGAIDLALQRSGEHLGADRAYLFLCTEDGRHISNTHEWCAPGIAPQRDKLQDLPYETIPWWWKRMARGEVVVVPDVAALPPEAAFEKALLEGQKIQSLFAFPLQKEGTTFGFVGYDAVRNRRNWAGEEIELLQVMADIVVSALARWRTEIELKASEKKMREAQVFAHLGYWSLNAETKTVEWSDEIFRIFGLSPATASGPETLENLVHPDDCPRVLESLERSLEQAIDHKLDYRVIRPDGGERWVDCRAKPVVDAQGHVIKLDGFLQDITYRKRAEQRRYESEALFSKAFQSAGTLMTISVLDTGVLEDVNEAFVETTGYARNDAVGTSSVELGFISSYNRERLKQTLLKQGSLRNLELEFAAKDRRVLYCLYNGEIIEIGGEKKLLSIVQDITPLKKSQLALQGERAFLQHVIDGIDDPILVISPDFKVLRMNRAAQQTAENSGWDASCVTCYQALHQSNQACSGEDRPCPLQTVLNTGFPCKVLHKKFLSSGEQRTFEIAASPLLDDDRRVIGIIEASRDITEHLSLLEELKERELRYAHLAQHDPLTGLPNRLLFADRLSQAIHVAHRNSTKFAVLYIDLDQFKHVNDSFDHSYGDEVLKAVSSRLQALFREEDTIARMGGDEFTVILVNIRHEEDAALVAGKVWQLFKEPFEIQGHNVFLGASIGISVYPNHGTTVDDLVRNADTAMYRAKEEGRNTFQYYSEELTERAFERVLLESNLHKALDRDELVLHYQPQLNLVTGDVCGLEALVRWQHPEMGLVSPAKFIPLAEDSGIIVPMGEWILHEACRQMKSWQDTGIVPRDTLISVNLSAKQFDHSDLIEMIAKAISETGLEFNTLELEITESTMMRSPDLSGHILQKLRGLGVKVAIDDFGTGYSSMSHLKLLPLTKLKIDQSFVSDIPQDMNDVAIAKAVIALASNLSLEVLAEGVETQEQQAFLTKEGCHSAQGYLFSRPLPARDLEVYMQNMNKPSLPAIC